MNSNEKARRSRRAFLHEHSRAVAARTEWNLRKRELLVAVVQTLLFGFSLLARCLMNNIEKDEYESRLHIVLEGTRS